MISAGPFSWQPKITSAGVGGFGVANVQEAASSMVIEKLTFSDSDPLSHMMHTQCVYG